MGNSRSKQLVTLDFDGTIAEQRGGWELLDEMFGTTGDGDRLTCRFDEGEIDFAQWCEGHATAWRERGVTQRHIQHAAEAVKLTTGADRLLTELQSMDRVEFGIISSGVTDLITCVEQYGPLFTDGNNLRFGPDGMVSGVEIGVGPAAKGSVVRSRSRDYDIDLKNVVHVGDSHTDTEAFDVVGRSILFCPDDRIENKYREEVDVLITERDLELVLSELTA